MSGEPQRSEDDMLEGDLKKLPRTLKFLFDVMGYAALGFVIWKAISTP
jgi:hypothetical protein